MSATLLTMALLSAGSLEDRCHWVPAYSVVPHRAPAMTVTRKPLQIIKPVGKRLPAPRVKWAYECSEAEAMRAAGPGLLPLVDDVPTAATVPPSDTYAIPAFEAPGAGQPAEEGAAPFYSLGAPVTVLGGGYLITASPVPAVPEPTTCCLLLAGITAIALRSTQRRTA